MNEELDDFDDEESIVFLQDEQVFGIIVKHGAHVSLVRYEKDGISYEVYVENDDIL